MKYLMKGRFLPLDYQWTLYYMFQQLQQVTMSVKEYAEKHHELSLRASAYKSEEAFTSKYRVGLSTAIQYEIVGFQLWNVEETYQTAL